MTALPGSRVLQFRLCEALESWLQERSLRQAAGEVGVSPQTIARWGSDLEAWGFALVRLAIIDGRIRQSLVEFIIGEERDSHPLRALSGVVELIAVMGLRVHELATAAADHEIDHDEASRLVTALDSLISDADEQRRNLRALVERARG